MWVLVTEMMSISRVEWQMMLLTNYMKVDMCAESGHVCLVLQADHASSRLLQYKQRMYAVVCVAYTQYVQYRQYIQCMQ